MLFMKWNEKFHEPGMIRCGINFVCLQNGDGSYKVVYHCLSATASLVG